jgi:tetratricopeptide (TPR) repeat protein
MPDDLAPLFKVDKDQAGNEVEKDPRATVAAAGKIANKLFYDAQQKEKTGHLAEAEQLYLRSIRVRNKFWGDKDPAVVKMYGLLGNLEMKVGHPANAEQFYKRTLQLALAKYGTGSYEIAPQLDALGNAMYAQKKYYDAANYFDQVHQLRERKFGQANPQTIAEAIKLADAYANNEEKGYWPDAEKLLSTNIRFLEANPDKTQLIKALEMYGRVLSKEGKEAEADKALNRLAELRSEPAVPSQSQDSARKPSVAPTPGK